MPTVRYFVASAGDPTYLNFDLSYGTLNLTGQQVVFNGTRYVESVFVTPGMLLDFSASGLGVDKLYLTGAFADYQFSQPSATSVRMRRSSGATLEQVTLSTSGGAGADLVVFSNGSASAAAALAAFSAGTMPALGALTSLAPGIPASSDVTVNAFMQGNGGGVLVSPDVAGTKLVISGTRGVDVVYVRDGAQVDATKLNLGTDQVYLRGHWAEYGKVVGTDTITFTRVVNGLSEIVSVAANIGGNNDQLIFADGAVLSNVAAGALRAAGGVALAAISGFDATLITPGTATLAIGAVGGGDSVNLLEKTAGVVISGVASLLSGATVNVTWGAVTHSAIAIASGGAWSTTFAAGEVPADASAAIVTASEMYGGKSLVSANRSVLIDTVAPQLTVGAVTLSVDSGSSATDYTTSTAAQTIQATLSAALAGGDVLEGSIDNGVSWTTLTGMLSGTSGTAITWTGATLAGASSIVFRLTDLAGNVGALTGSSAYVLDTTAPVLSAGAVSLSADTGASSGDLVTHVAPQTIHATLSGALAAGDILEGSLDNGSSWTDITAMASGTNLNWSGATLLGSSHIVFRLTDLAGNIGSNIGSAAYVLDTIAPTTSASSVALSIDSGASSGDFITNVAAQTISGSLSAATVAGELVKISLDGGASWALAGNAIGSAAFTFTGALQAGSGNTVLVRLEDAAGNAGAVNRHAYTLDTTAPGVTVGAVSLTFDSGTSSSDLVTHVAQQTIHATLSGALGAGDILEGSLDNGLSWIDITAMASGTSVDWSGATLGTALAGASAIAFRVTDLAGNVGAPTGSAAYVLDTLAPALTVSAVSLGVDSGTSTTDLITRAAPQTIDASLSGALGAGDILEGSSDNGVTWLDISAMASGTAISWTGATLVGSSHIVFRLTDLAGNIGANTGIAAYVLDSLAPATTVSAVSLTFDSGTSSSDLVTHVAQQTIHATLSGALAAGDILAGSIDNGASWQDITAMAAGTAISWGGATLSGSNNIVFRITDLAGNVGASTGATAYLLDTSAPSTTISSVALSLDSGSSNLDFTTNSAAQTISGTLSGATVAGEVVQLSVDGGATWMLAANTVGSAAFTFAGALQAGSGHSLLVRIEDAAGNLGPVNSNAYLLDTSAPLLSVDGVSLSLDTGTSSSDLVTNVAQQTLHATLSGALTGSDMLEGSLDNGASWIDITAMAAGTAINWTGATLLGASSIIFRVTDLAGNVGAPTGGAAYVLDTAAPVLTVGAVALSVDSGASASDLVTSAQTPTIHATLSGALGAGDMLEGSTNNGVTWVDISAMVAGSAISWTGATLSGSDSIAFRLTDVTGNVGAQTGSTAYVLDTTAPLLTVDAVALGVDSGASGTDLLTNVAAQTVHASLSGALAAGDMLEGSLDNGASWRDITAMVAGSAITWSGATLGTALAGASAIVFRITDLAGNAGSPTGATAYVLDTAAPGTVASTVALSADTGTSGSDFITNTSQQVITGTLSAASVAGELVQVSLDSGATWAGAVNTLGSTAFRYNGALLAGAGHTLQVRLEDGAGNAGAVNSIPYTFDTSALTTTVSSLALSSDSGSSALDFITNVGAQTISGTLSGATAAGDVVMLSLDGGATAALASNTVGSSTFTYSGSLLAGAGRQLQVWLENAAGNAGIVNGHAYLLDTTAPAATVGAVALASDTGTSASDLVTSAPQQTVHATLSSPLANGDILEGSTNNGASWIDITGMALGTDIQWIGATLLGSSGIAFRLTDLAGNVGATTGTVSYVLDTSAPLLTVSAVALGADSGTSDTDLVTNVAAQTINATLSGALSLGDILSGSTDNGATWTDITAMASGTAIRWSGALLAGANSIAFRLTDLAGNVGATSGPAAYVFDNSAPGSTVSAVSLSLDTGVSSSDLVTSVAQQTIHATLSGALAAGDMLAGSLDNGAHWLDITAMAAGTSLNWTGATLLGSSNIVFRLTDLAGNVGATSGSTAYVLDTSALSTSVTSVALSTDSGTSGLDFITNSAAQTISGSLSAATASGETVQVSVDSGATWAQASNTVGSGTFSLAGTLLAGSGNTLQLRLQNIAGNVGATNSVAYTLDTAAPSLTLGGVTLSLDTGASSLDLVTNVAAQTVHATLSGALNSGDILAGSLDGGVTWSDISAMASGSAISWSGATLAGSSSIVFKVTDLAGNVGATTGSAAYVLDTTAPVLTVSGVALSVDTGTSGVDLVTNLAAQTIAATLSGALAAGDVLAGSTDNGVSWHDITAMASGSAIHWSGATLVGSNNIVFRISDLAGNTGALTGMAAYLLDTSAPLNTVSAVSLNFDTGTSSSDLVTSTALQTLHASLSGLLAAGDILAGSTNNGATWTNITAMATGTTISWSGVTLLGSSNIVFKITDLAGNAGASTGSTAYVLDTAAPTTSASSVALSLDSGTSNSDFITNSAAQTISGSLSAATVAGELVQLSLDGGATWALAANTVGSAAFSFTGALQAGSGNTLQVRLADAAGNVGPVNSNAYLLDTTAPALTIGAVSLSADSGTSSSDLITKVAQQTLHATLSGALSLGDILEG